MLPDEAAPAGGIRHAYVLVDELIRLGYEATVWHGEYGFRCGWFTNETPVVNSIHLRLSAGDILVVPEWGGRRFAPLVAEARVVINVQSHFLIFSGANAHDDWGGTYPGWPNAMALLVSSRAIHDFTNKITLNSLPTFMINVDVGDAFAPAAKQRVVAFMSRRRASDLAATVQLLRRSPAMRGWKFDDISGVGRDDVAARLGRAAIFLAGSDREGFGLPPAEAMASGCYVIGFTGDGGREFMLEDHCSVIQDQNLVAFAGEVERIAQLWDRDRASVGRKTELARQFVRSHYSRGNLVDSLSRAFGELTTPDSPARQTEAVTVHHYASLQHRRTAKGVVRRWLPPVITEAIKNRRS